MMISKEVILPSQQNSYSNYMLIILSLCLCAAQHLFSVQSYQLLHSEKVTSGKGYSWVPLIGPLHLLPFSIWQSSVLCEPSFRRGKVSLYVSTPFGRKNNFQMVSYSEMEAEKYTCDTCCRFSSEVLLLYCLIPVM